MALPERPKRKSNHLKLKGGESAIGILIPHDVKFKHIAWEGGKSKETDHDDPDAKLRCTLHFVHREGENLTPKLFECSGMLYDRICEIENLGHELMKTWVQIKRTGSGMQTRWSIDAAPNGSLDEAAQSTLNVICADLGISIPADDVPQEFEK